MAGDTYVVTLLRSDTYGNAGKKVVCRINTLYA